MTQENKNEDIRGCSALFDMDSVRQDSPRLAELKNHDIQTHHAPDCNPPWIAVPMKAAVDLLAGYKLTEEEKNSLPAIMSGFCRFLDESGMVFDGDSEREVQDAALDFCRSNNLAQAPTTDKYHE